MRDEHKQFSNTGSDSTSDNITGPDGQLHVAKKGVSAVLKRHKLLSVAIAGSRVFKRRY